MQPVKLVILGKPVSQKNDKRIVRSGNRTFIASSKKVLTWKSDAVRQLEEQWAGRQCIDGGIELSVDVISYLGKRQRTDVDNLAAGPLDSLEKAGIIANDYWIKKLLCERLKDDSNPRVEITIRLYSELGDERREDELLPELCS